MRANSLFFIRVCDFLTYKNQKEFDSYDENRREAVIYILKMRPEKIKIAEPVISSDKASFTVEALETPGEKMTGSIKMIFENGKWRVSEDKWKIEQIKNGTQNLFKQQ